MFAAAATLQPTLAAPSQRGQQQAASLPAPQRAAGLSSRASPAVRGGAAAAAALAAQPAPRSAAARAAQRPVMAAAAAPGSAGSVAIAGATGLIGTVLVRQLQAQGYAVRVLARNPVAARAKLPYPGLQFVAPAQWAEAVCGCTAVVNLAGEGLGGCTAPWDDWASFARLPGRCEPCNGRQAPRTVYP